MEEDFFTDGFRKLTGPIEHWLTTYHTGYWGFRPDKEDAWEAIEEGEIFLFHASASKFLDVPRREVKDAGKAVIGLGRVGAKSTKSEPAWWEEVHQDGNYPFLIHFSEIHWFGDTDSIRDVPVADKSTDEMVADVHRLDENKITFAEMDERAGYRIPAQGSPGNIKYPEKLFPLLVERLRGDSPTDLVSPQSQDATGDTSARESSSIRKRSRDRNLDPEQSTSETVSYSSSVDQTMSGWIEHEHALDVFEDHLLNAGFDSGETKHSDILASRDGYLVLAEAKFIHDGNERSQIRTAIGQLHEYGYFDVQNDPERRGMELVKCLVFTKRPSESYLPFLKSLSEDGIHTFWIDEYEVLGLQDSLEKFSQITS
ncbi:hypothetical protein C5B86_10055 [Haloferax sp. Atlit-19N]|uniref:hypothetical protein n=1 Tax=Haloferax sp. Atlit-19N TaxID=2077201 RepID=UPI000E26CEB4|nr:hypothetical protein [Haloferax sp. Atlit-19N]RDZ46065.1 hypothetical protein C5B86_10055 [Haloferax sp. Atlit-19N]